MKEKAKTMDQQRNVQIRNDTAQRKHNTIDFNSMKEKARAIDGNEPKSIYTGDKRKDAEMFRNRIADMDKEQYMDELKVYKEATAPKLSGNKLLDFISRTGQVGANLVMGATPEESGYVKPIDTGSSKLNTASDILGMITGFAGGAKAAGTLSGSNVGLMGKGLSIGQNAAGKLSQSKGVLGNIAKTRVGQNVIEGAVPGAMMDVSQGIKEKDDPIQLAARVIVGALAGGAIDAGAAALSPYAKNVLKKLSKNDLDNVIKNISKEKNIPEETIKNQIDFHVSPEGQAIKDFNPNGLLLQAPKEGVSPIDRLTKDYRNEINNFENWRKKNFGGAFGKMSEGDTKALKELYREDTGIDIDDITMQYKNSSQAIGRRDDLRRTIKPANMINQSMEPEITVNTFSGPKKVNTNTIRDSQGKTLEETLSPKAQETVDNIIKDLDGASVQPDETVRAIAGQLKDKSGISYNMTDVYRNFKDAFGNRFDHVKRVYLDPFDASKKKMVDMEKDYTDSLYNNVVKKLGITKDSKLSKAVQEYGEGKRLIGYEDIVDPQTGKKYKKAIMEPYTLTDLQEDFPNDWEKVVEADKWFRTQYDELIDTINESRKQIYPNVAENAEKSAEKLKFEIEYDRKRIADIEEQLAKGLGNREELLKTQRILKSKMAMDVGKFNKLRKDIDSGEVSRNKLIPKRQDYYRHFREMADTFAGVKNLFETPSQIDPSLAGVSDFTKPKTKWFSPGQRRGMGGYKADAVEGFLDYIKAASYAANIDPHISKFRGLAKDIAESTSDTKNANNFIEYLQDFANDLAGKTNSLDRAAQKYLGRRTFKVLSWINSRVKANTVLGNISSSLSQIANVPQGIAFIKNPAYLSKGAGDTMTSFVGKGKLSKLEKQSQFLTERFSGKIYNKFDTKMIDQPKKFAAWMLGALDEVGTKFIWSSAYNKAIAEGIPNAVKYADDNTRRLVAGRGVGELPLMQKSKLFQLVAPFQVEVANLWNVQKDFVKAKDFGGLLMLYLSNYILNKGMEGVRGSGVVFDPISAIEDSINEDLTTGETAGRLAGEVFSNMPLGQTIASSALFPEYGGKVDLGIGEINIPARKQIFGDNDPTRFGSGLLAADALTDPLYKLVFPFGGSQTKKTLKAAKDFNLLPRTNPEYKAQQRQIQSLEKQLRTAKGETNIDNLTSKLDELKKKDVDRFTDLPFPASYTSKGDKLRTPVKTTATNITKGLLFGEGGIEEVKKFFEENKTPYSQQQTEKFINIIKENKFDPNKIYAAIDKTRGMRNKKDIVTELNRNKDLTRYEKLVILTKFYGYKGE